ARNEGRADRTGFRIMAATPSDIATTRCSMPPEPGDPSVTRHEPAIGPSGLVHMYGMGRPGISFQSCRRCTSPPPTCQLDDAPVARRLVQRPQVGVVLDVVARIAQTRRPLEKLQRLLLPPEEAADHRVGEGDRGVAGRQLGGAGAFLQGALVVARL